MSIVVLSLTFKVQLSGQDSSKLTLSDQQHISCSCEYIHYLYSFALESICALMRKILRSGTFSTSQCKIQA